MTERKKILWLVSWYPNKTDVFDGDFIQRHAKAASLFDDIHVIFVKDAEQEEELEEEWRNENGLTEQIIYFKKPQGVLARFKKQVTWRKLFLKAAEDYIREHGKPHLVHVHVPWKAGLIALALKKKYGMKYFVTEHSGIYNNVVEDRYSNKPALVRKLTKRIFEKADQFVSVSRFLAEGISSLVVKRAYDVIPNTVDTSLFHHSEQKHPVFTFIHVSNMVPLKNVSGILKAFYNLIHVHSVRNVQLILIGNKDDKYVQEANNFGLQNTHVSFRGEVCYETVALEMQQAHCLVLNSCIENSPCVIGEALCCGLPVIATKVGGIPELVTEQNAILIDTDVNSLAQAMKKMATGYSGFQPKHIAAQAAEKFSYSAIGKAFSETYRIKM